MVWSTEDVTAAEAPDYWSDVVGDAFAHVITRPVAGTPFYARISRTDVGGAGIAALSSSAQQVRRTPRQIAKDDNESLLVNIQLTGHARLFQDDRVAILSPGTMAFVDSTRPYTLDCSGAFSKLVVRIPRSLLTIRSLSGVTAIALPSSGPAGLVTDFFTRLAQLDSAVAAEVLPHGIGLLEYTVGRATGPAPSDATLTRARIDSFVRKHACDPRLDADTVAAACGVSRRTLFRTMAGDSLAGLIREHRIVHAKRLLHSSPALTLTAVAHSSGFASTSQFHRAFRAATGVTPAAYRS